MIKGKYYICTEKINVPERIIGLLIMAKIEVVVTKVTQSANEILGTEEKNLYYMAVGEGEEKLVVNIGEKTYLGIQKILNAGSVTTDNKDGKTKK